MIISILICSLYERAGMLAGLLREIHSQIDECEAKDKVEVITLIDNRERATGSKRNDLYDKAIGTYSVSIDDDDRIPPYYISELLKAAEEGKDCFAINGIITFNGANEKKWYISKDLPYDTIKDMYGDEIYRRYPNHICPIKSEITKQVKFQDITVREDYLWATEIHNLKLIKSETIINPPMYFYDYKNK